MGANKKIGINKIERDLANKYCKRFNLYEPEIQIRRKYKTKTRVLYLVATDGNEITYRIRYDKVKLMRRPKGTQIISRLNYLIHTAELVHGEGTYDYSLVEESEITYENKLPIVCDIHGVFMKSKRAHVKNREGCPKCSRRRLANNRKYFKKNGN